MKKEIIEKLKQNLDKIIETFRWYDHVISQYPELATILEMVNKKNEPKR